jgi:nicotinate-nucleotide adenylyltransferase
MRIGLFGGTFNPVHSGHIALARAAKIRLKLDKVIFIPAYIPPHKDAIGIIDAKDRFCMIELAISQNAGFEISRYEIDKEEKVYSVETVRHFKDIYPEGTEIFFLAGADSLSELDAWKDVDKIFTLCRFVIFSRPGFSKDNSRVEVETIDIEEVNISSTRIRERVRRNNPIDEMVPEQVADYIAKNNLYKQVR